MGAATATKIGATTGAVGPAANIIADGGLATASRVKGESTDGLSVSKDLAVGSLCFIGVLPEMPRW